MRILKGSLLALVAMLTIVTLAGCGTWRHSEATSSSVVEFLFPDGAPEPDDAVPRLRVPVKVGLAFVPASRDARCGRCSGAPSAALQADLLEQVRARFKDRPYVADIVVIPEAYLRQGRGFTTVEQLARLYGFDVIALVSYDQVGLESERKSSLLYLTVAGAYVVKGNHHDVHTFVDTAVFDVKTRKLLFRAPGVDVRAFNTTLVDSRYQGQQGAEASLRVATAGMIEALDRELGAFRERIKADNSVIVEPRAASFRGGGGGGGSVGVIVLIALLAGALLRTTGIARARAGAKGGMR